MLAQRYQKKMLKCNKNNYKSNSIRSSYAAENLSKGIASVLKVSQS
jgi:hypothetical protein